MAPDPTKQHRSVVGTAVVTTVVTTVVTAVVATGARSMVVTGL
jgi:hypothetical protein